MSAELHNAHVHAWFEAQHAAAAQQLKTAFTRRRAALYGYLLRSRLS